VYISSIQPHVPTMAKINVSKHRQNLRERAKAARTRLRALRGKARVGDVMSPSGERWNAERGRC